MKHTVVLWFRNAFRKPPTKAVTDVENIKSFNPHSDQNRRIAKHLAQQADLPEKNVDLKHYECISKN